MWSNLWLRFLPPTTISESRLADSLPDVSLVGRSTRTTNKYSTIYTPDGNFELVIMTCQFFPASSYQFALCLRGVICLASKMASPDLYSRGDGVVEGLARRTRNPQSRVRVSL